ncbi:MAG: GIY-YIG nuclease family protein [Planctomycetota bacterium]
MWHVYILKCVDGSFYTGITNNIRKRIDAHNSGKGARYTRSRRPVRLIYKKKCPDLSAAFKRERAIKKMTRKMKKALVRNKR